MKNDKPIPHQFQVGDKVKIVGPSDSAFIRIGKPGDVFEIKEVRGFVEDASIFFKLETPDGKTEWYWPEEKWYWPEEIELVKE